MLEEAIVPPRHSFRSCAFQMPSTCHSRAAHAPPICRPLAAHIPPAWCRSRAAYAPLRCPWPRSRGEVRGSPHPRCHHIAVGLIARARRCARRVAHASRCLCLKESTPPLRLGRVDRTLASVGGASQSRRVKAKRSVWLQEVPLLDEVAASEVWNTSDFEILPNCGFTVLEGARNPSFLILRDREAQKCHSMIHLGAPCQRDDFSRKDPRCKTSDRACTFLMHSAKNTDMFRFVFSRQGPVSPCVMLR